MHVFTYNIHSIDCRITNSDNVSMFNALYISIGLVNGNLLPCIGYQNIG